MNNLRKVLEDEKKRQALIESLANIYEKNGIGTIGGDLKKAADYKDWNLEGNGLVTQFTNLFNSILAIQDEAVLNDNLQAFIDALPSEINLDSILSGILSANVQPLQDNRPETEEARPPGSSQEDEDDSDSESGSRGASYHGGAKTFVRDDTKVADLDDFEGED